MYVDEFGSMPTHATEKSQVFLSMHTSENTKYSMRDFKWITVLIKLSVSSHQAGVAMGEICTYSTSIYSEQDDEYSN